MFFKKLKTMNAKITATFVIIAALVGLNSTVYAQSKENPQPGNFTLSGDSLININNRNSENDFGKFFNQQNPGSISNTTGTENTVSQQSPLNNSITIPSTPIFLQPAYQNLNENDGLQLQLDLSDGN